MLKELRPIQTRYKGYRFRSRLEARWAVFFDALELRWEYEPEGFHTTAGMYLPDFLVFTPQGNRTWYEVKPDDVLNDAKADAFGGSLSGLSARFAVLSGDPMTHLSREGMGICPRCAFIHVPEYGFEPDYGFGCAPCDFETPSGGYHPKEDGLAGFLVSPHKGVILAPWDALSDEVARAAIAARSARFEHGERG